MAKNNSKIRNLLKVLGDLPAVLITSFYTDTSDLYETLGVQPGVDHFLNLGWWTDELQNRDNIDETIITEACRELVRRLAEFGHLQPDDRILDVGFGFAQQDVLLAGEYDCEDITGINITPYQVHKGRELVGSKNKSDSITLHVGDAVKLPYRDNHFDKVFALETAFHFHTREAFFAEANRVLKDDGVLVTADIIDGPIRESTASYTAQLLASAHENYWNIPPENRIDTPKYEKALYDKNFDEVEIKNVSERVLKPWTEHYLTWRNKRQTIPIKWFGSLMLKLIKKFYRDDYFRYIFAKAQK